MYIRLSKAILAGVFVMLVFSLIAGCGGSESTTPTAAPTQQPSGQTQQTNDSSKVDASEAEVDERADWPKKVRFAVDGIDGLEELQRRYQVFQEVISDLMGVEFELFPLANRTVVVTAMEFDQIDVGLIGPAEYVQMKAAVPEISIAAALQRDKYHAVFVVPQDSSIQTLEDLRGKKISMKEIGSGSGHIAPSSILIDAGFDLDRDVEILFLGNAAIEALRAGEVDAIAEGVRVYDTMVAEDGPDTWKLLHEGPPLPQDPFVVGPNLPQSFKDEFRRVLIEHQDEVLNAILVSEDNKKYNKATIVNIENHDFDLMRETYAILGIELK